MDQLPVPQQEMSFLDHLEELRWHVIRAVIAILVFAILAFVGKSFVFGQLILGPSRTEFWTYEMLCKLGKLINTSAICISDLPFIIQSRQMTGQFTMHITSSFAVGLICAFPYAFWEVWRFIAPGLYVNERRVARGAVFYVSLLFSIGVLFG
jgi:sec-independent protein translocase protein TatC